MVILPTSLLLLSNHSAPSGPAVIDPVQLGSPVKIEMVPVVVIRPIELVGFASLVNQSAPSGPVVIPSGCLMPGPVKVDTLPDVVILPIDP